MCIMAYVKSHIILCEKSFFLNYYY